MPKATAEARQQNAHERALATVAAMEPTPQFQHQSETPDQTCPACGKQGWAIDEFLSPHNGRCSDCQGIMGKISELKKEEQPLPETAEADDETEGDEVTAAEAARVKKSKKWDKAGGEDFFEYMNSIPQEERTQGRLRFFATNADGSIGGMVHQIVGGWAEVDEAWMRNQPEIGIGKFKVELRNPGRTGRANDWTIIQIGSDEEISKLRRTKQHSNKEGTVEDSDKAVDVVASAAEKGMGFLGKSYEKALEVRQNSSDPVAMARALVEMGGKGNDTGALLAGLASIIGAIAPKKDDEGQKLLFTMLEGQRKDAERRAEQAEKDADRREQRAKEEAERREREADRRATDAKAEADRQRERDKEFFGILLKQSESKADSLNQMTGLLTSFMKVKETIDDTMGAGPKGPWDLVGNALDGVMQHGPAIVAAMKGAPAQEVQRMQQQSNPAPGQQEIPPFYEMIIRLDKYLARDPQLYDGEYVVQMIQEEFDGVYNDIFKMPKETVVNSIAAFDPPGKAIMERPQSAEFMSKVIDAIKFPDTMDDIFGGEPEPDDEKEPIILHGKARKINGRAKVERAG